MNVGSSRELLLSSDDSALAISEELSKSKKLSELANIKKNANNLLVVGGAATKIAGNRGSPQSNREKFWLYTTLFLSMITVATGTSLLFLVPLYVDPAISTLTADFTPEPVLCTTSRRDDYTGLFNCSWSSCREGCTSDMYRCTHIYVRYSADDRYYSQYSTTTAVSTTTAAYYNNKRQASSLDEIEAVFLVNIKGCGYPPTVRCVNFTDKYGRVGASFPCYYSRQNKTVTMYRYDRTEHVRTIVQFFVVPFCLCIVSSCALCVMHCDCCRLRLRESFGRGNSVDGRNKKNRRDPDDSDQSISNRVDKMAASTSDDVECSRPL